jgi:hypothetical protein
MNKVTRRHKTENTKTLILRGGFLVLITLITACAGQVPVQPVAAGTSIQVTTPESRMRNPNAQGGGEAVGKRLAQGAGMGVAGGLAAGLYGSMACGPFFMFCAPVLVGGGAAIGLVAGSTAGTISGAIIALPNEKANALDAIIDSTFAEITLSQSLRAEFEEQTAGVWAITDTEQDVRVTIELESFFIEQFKDDNLKLKMTSTMVVTNGIGKSATTKEIPFAYDGGRQHVDYWLENDGENFRIEMEDAFASNVMQMIRLLKTGSAPSSSANTSYAHSTATEENLQLQTHSFAGDPEAGIFDCDLFVTTVY